MKDDGILPRYLKGLLLSVGGFLAILVICFIQFAGTMNDMQQKIAGMPAAFFWLLMILLDVCLYTSGILLVCLVFLKRKAQKEGVRK